MQLAVTALDASQGVQGMTWRAAAFLLCPGWLAPPSSVAGAEARLVPKPVEAETPFVCPSGPDVSCLWVEGRVSTWTHVTSREQTCISLSLLQKEEGKIGGLFLFF